MPIFQVIILAVIFRNKHMTLTIAQQEGNWNNMDIATQKLIINLLIALRACIFSHIPVI